MPIVDMLADALSERTGTKFEVVRIHIANNTLRYALRAEREGLVFGFQLNRGGCSLNEMKSWLASISDMINFGFIPVASPQQIDRRAATWYNGVTNRRDDMSRLQRVYRELRRYVGKDDARYAAIRLVKEPAILDLWAASQSFSG